MRGVATTAAVVLLLGGLTAFYTTRLATERDRAQLEAAKAAKVSELLTGLLTGADPYANRATHEASRPSAGCSMPAPSGCRKSSPASPSCRPRC